MSMPFRQILIVGFTLALVCAVEGSGVPTQTSLAKPVDESINLDMKERSQLVPVLEPVANAFVSTASTPFGKDTQEDDHVVPSCWQVFKNLWSRFWNKIRPRRTEKDTKKEVSSVQSPTEKKSFWSRRKAKAPSVQSLTEKKSFWSRRKAKAPRKELRSIKAHNEIELHGDSSKHSIEGRQQQQPVFPDIKSSEVSPIYESVDEVASTTERREPIEDSYGLRSNEISGSLGKPIYSIPDKSRKSTAATQPERVSSGKGSGDIGNQISGVSDITDDSLDRLKTLQRENDVVDYLAFETSTRESPSGIDENPIVSTTPSIVYEDLDNFNVYESLPFDSDEEKQPEIIRLPVPPSSDEKKQPEIIHLPVHPRDKTRLQRIKGKLGMKVKPLKRTDISGNRATSQRSRPLRKSEVSSPLREPIYSVPDESRKSSSLKRSQSPIPSTSSQPKPRLPSMAKRPLPPTPFTSSEPRPRLTSTAGRPLPPVPLEPKITEESADDGLLEESEESPYLMPSKVD